MKDNILIFILQERRILLCLSLMLKNRRDLVGDNMPLKDSLQHLLTKKFLVVISPPIKNVVKGMQTWVKLK
jgi:hypothetical protein